MEHVSPANAGSLDHKVTATASPHRTVVVLSMIHSDRGILPPSERSRQQRRGTATGK